MTNERCLPVVAILVCAATVSQAMADDWLGFRGPNRSGVSAESSGWNDAESLWSLTTTWQRNVGVGASSPVVHDGRLYVAGHRDKSDVFTCLDAKSGSVVWTQNYAAPRYGRHSKGDQGLYRGICSTPEVDAETKLAYTLGIDGELRCWDLARKGATVWRLNLYDQFQMPQRPKVGRSGHRDYGYTSSALVQNTTLIVEVGSPQHGCLIGFDKRTGKVLWKSQARNLAGHTAGPVPQTVDGVPCVAVHHFDGWLVARVDKGHEGETVAEGPWRTDFGNNIASIAVAPNNIVVTSHYNHQKIQRFRVAMNAPPQRVWSADVSSKVCTPVIVGGHVYFSWQQLHCLDWETGKLRWKGGRFSDAGSVIATKDNRLIVWGGRGDLALVEGAARSPQRYSQLALMKRLGGNDAWPHVTLANGRIYCKDRLGNLTSLIQQ